jgi:hypothetical protein
MDRLGKYVCLCLVVILAASILLIIKPADAQSVSKPSAPKFTIQFPNSNQLQIVIENQIFVATSTVNSIVYFYRVKDHSSEQWIRDSDYKLQSDSKNTIISLPKVPGTSLFPPMIYSSILNNATLIDFQVQAQTGYYAITNVSGPPHLISPAPQQWHTEITFNESETSDWSNTLTVDLCEMAVINPSPTPTVPEFPVTISLFAVLFTVSLLLIIGKRKLVVIKN